MKKCTICREDFTQFNSLTKVCSPKCALALVQKAKVKKWAKEKVEYRKENKKIIEWIKEAQASINTYVRLRDHHLPCISCNSYRTDDNLHGSNWHAGHYRSTGSAPHLRFNLINIRKQCAHCNNFLSGNVVEYRKNLLELIGPEKLEALETNNGYKKYNREYCERVKRIFNKKAKMKKKRLGID